MIKVLRNQYLKHIGALQSVLGDDNKMSDKAKKAYKSTENTENQ